MHITISVGLYAVARITAQDSLEQLLSKADAALYLAKNNGRNQVHQYASPSAAAEENIAPIA